MLRHKQKSQVAGLTLIELLIVIAILIIVTAAIVPQIRTISKERSIREATRVTGGFLVEASNRARAEGFGGVAIFRNPRATRDVGGALHPTLYYVGNSMAQLKFTTPFVGNTESDLAFTTTGSVNPVRIAAPYDPSILIEIGSYIQFGTSPVKYLITGVAPGLPGELNLTIDLPAYQPRPAGNKKFRIWRRPKINENTRISLPRGYLVNLNYSGHLGPAGNDFAWTTFSQPQIDDATAQQPVIILFDEKGGVDRIYPNGLNGASYVPHSATLLCIAEDDLGNTFLGNSMPQSYVTKGTDLLDDPTMMWITIDHETGSVNPAQSSPPITPIPGAAPYLPTQQLRILESLQIGGKRQIAEQ
jgi:type II secretory pathway pseudopilin PulG